MYYSRQEHWKHYELHWSTCCHFFNNFYMIFLCQTLEKRQKSCWEKHPQTAALSCRCACWTTAWGGCSTGCDNSTGTLKSLVWCERLENIVLRLSSLLIFVKILNTLHFLNTVRVMQIVTEYWGRSAGVKAPWEELKDNPLKNHMHVCVSVTYRTQWSPKPASLPFTLQWSLLLFGF